jgi:predicted Zn-dependent protease
VKDAELKLTAYRRRWGVGEFEVKSSQMETLLSSIKVEDQDGASRGLSQARSYYEAGSSSLAEEILLALLDQFPGSPALEDVQELLQTIQAEE